MRSLPSCCSSARAYDRGRHYDTMRDRTAHVTRRSSPKRHSSRTSPRPPPTLPPTSNRSSRGHETQLIRVRLEGPGNVPVSRKQGPGGTAPLEDTLPRTHHRRGMPGELPNAGLEVARCSVGVPVAPELESPESYQHPGFRPRGCRHEAGRRDRLGVLESCSCPIQAGQGLVEAVLRGVHQRDHVRGVPGMLHDGVVGVGRELVAWRSFRRGCAGEQSSEYEKKWVATRTFLFKRLCPVNSTTVTSSYARYSAGIRSKIVPVRTPASALLDSPRFSHKNSMRSTHAEALESNLPMALFVVDASALVKYRSAASRSP